MAKTIKLKVIEQMAKHSKGVTRKKIQEFIWFAQGKEAPFRYRQGYYGTGIQEWEYQGLIEQIGGRGTPYRVTYSGKKYIKDPKFLRIIKLKREIKGLRRANENYRERAVNWFDKKDALTQLSELTEFIENI